MVNVHNLGEIAEAIDLPLEKWRRNCHVVSCAVIREGLMEGRAVFGHYYGHASPKSPLYVPGHPCYPHGWIVQPDGTIADFTRWVFEAVQPYLFVGKNNEEYDESGSRVRRTLAFPMPPPVYDPHQRRLNLRLRKETRQYVLDELLGGSPGVTFQQGVWLANVDLKTLSKHAREIFEALADRRLKELIPIDNWNAVMTEKGYE